MKKQSLILIADSCTHSVFQDKGLSDSYANSFRMKHIFWVNNCILWGYILANRLQLYLPLLHSYKIAYRSVIGFLKFFIKKAGGQLAIFSVIMQAFTALKFL